MVSVAASCNKLAIYNYQIADLVVICKAALQPPSNKSPIYEGALHDKSQIW